MLIMKTKITKLIAITLLAFLGLSNYLCAQTLFKDLNPGASFHSQPDQFMEVNGTMYFHTNTGNSGGYWHALWKSDGTAANTVVLKDSIISTAVGGVVTLRANVNGSLFFSVNKVGVTAGDTTHLWKTDGTVPVLIKTLPHPGYPGTGGGYPQNFTVVGNKLFFDMWQYNGRELWVTDGTASGTMEVIDLNPGNNGGTLKYGGSEGKPMVSFKGKVYFSGGTTLGLYELYSSDGTVGGTALVKSGTANPENFIVYQNQLYFGTNGGTKFWKTDGTTAGTIKIADSAFNKATIFANKMFFTTNGKLWKSDGTASGTTLVMDSAGTVIGANNNFLFTSYMKTLTAPPYYETRYWKSDGTTAGTVRISDTLGVHASFVVLNNKMYSGLTMIGSTQIKGFWETDGTDAGTIKFIPNSSPGNPFVFKNTLFFSNTDATSGVELWSYTPAGSSGINETVSSDDFINIYPNPSTGIVKIESRENKNYSVQIYNLLGEEINLNQRFNELDFSNSPKGIYLLRVYDGTKFHIRKIVIQ